ncbi:MAG: pyridoxal-dependent decarboxylase, exosortase A system-associated [Alphaproteobacteria bacterium]
MTAAPPPGHAPLAALTVVDGCLQIGGVPLPRLADRVGGTPFYAYDRAAVSNRVAYLRRHLPEGVGLHYAVKANPMPELIGHLAGLVDGFDVASRGELDRVLAVGPDPARITFTGPGKDDDELAAAVTAGVLINVESEGELRRLATLAEKTKQSIRIGLRVNPEFEVKGSGMHMGGGARQFGIDAERIPDVLDTLAGTGLTFEGFHVFAGSQCLDARTLCESQALTVDLVLRLAERAPGPVRRLNIGGGFGIPYFPGETQLDLEAVGAGLAVQMERLATGLPKARVSIELGRYLVGEAGVYVTRVLDRKESRGRVFLVTDGGLHQNLAASGNLGQVIRRNYPLAIGTRMDAPATETVTVVGRLCTPIDLLGDRIELPEAGVGDLIVIFQSGAYGFSASPVAFLGHPPPREVLV